MGGCAVIALHLQLFSSLGLGRRRLKGLLEGTEGSEGVGFVCFIGRIFSPRDHSERLWLDLLGTEVLPPSGCLSPFSLPRPAFSRKQGSGQCSASADQSTAYPTFPAN